MLDGRGAVQALRRIPGGQPGVLRSARGRDPRPDRAERLGQEHDLQPDRGQAAPDRAARSASTAQEIGGLPAHTRSAVTGIARTFQIPRPFRKLSLLENVTLAAYYGAGRRHRRAPKRSAAPRRRSSWSGCRPTQRRTTDGLGAAALKKLELARALATKPQLLLADESLGGLDHDRDGARRRHARQTSAAAWASPSSGSSTSWAC